jgi:AcrR family transcriptional regulator
MLGADMTKRAYELGSRAEAMRATRERILDVGEELFLPRWFDEVTIADVAKAAGVSAQTVVNHFGSKEQLYLAGVVERVSPRIEALRAKAIPGDLDSIVEIACEDYEATGDGTVRLVAIAARSEGLSVVVKFGSAMHHAWIDHCFAPWLDELSPAARRHQHILISAILDVSTWHTLRRVEGLSIAKTQQALRDILEPLLKP